MPYGIVYKITNLTNGKLYVGQTVRPLEKRWKQHIEFSKRSSYPIHASIQKHGKDNFTIEVICECETQEELDTQELYFANTLNSFSPSGYNLKAGQGHGSFSEETKNKMSKSASGRRASEQSKSIRSLASKGEKNPFFGKTHSKESLDKMSESLTGKYAGEQSWHFGKPKTEKHKKKLSDAKLGKYTGENHHFFGKSHSEKAKKTISDKKSKIWEFRSPQGEIVVIKNLKKFCQENPNKLGAGNMRRVYHGEQKHHKGWTKI